MFTFPDNHASFGINMQVGSSTAYPYRFSPPVMPIGSWLIQRPSLGQ